MWSGRDSSISIAVRLRAGRLRSQGSILGKVKRCFSSITYTTSSGSHPASYTMGTGGAFFSEVKRQGREGDHAPASRAEVKNGGGILPLLPYALMAWC
jgi:hypothetical protein